jgi:hypothetical protein
LVEGANVDEPTTERITQRLDRLERENRWWRVGAVGLLLLVTVGAGRNVTDEIRAKRFTVIDQSGTKRAELAMWGPGEPRLALFDARGIERASLALWLNGAPDLILRDRHEGAPRLLLGLTTDKDEPRLRLQDGLAEGRRLRAVVGHIELDAPSSGATVRLPASSVVLFDNNGKVVWKAP